MALRRNGHMPVNAERRTELKFKSMILLLARMFVTFTNVNNSKRADVRGEHRADKIWYR